MTEVTLEMLGELMQRMLAEVRELRGELRSLEEQILVQGGILMRVDARLEAQQPLSQDTGVMAAIQQQLIRLDRRLRALEER